MLKKTHYVVNGITGNADRKVGIRRNMLAGVAEVLVVAPASARIALNELFGTSRVPTLAACNIITNLLDIPAGYPGDELPETATVYVVSDFREGASMSIVISDDKSEVGVHLDNDEFLLVVSGEASARVCEAMRHMSVAATASLAEVLAAGLDVPADELAEFVKALEYAVEAPKSRVTLIDEIW